MVRDEGPDIVSLGDEVEGWDLAVGTCDFGQADAKEGFFDAFLGSLDFRSRLQVDVNYGLIELAVSVSTRYFCTECCLPLARIELFSLPS